MRLWPWNKPLETRADVSYTDALVAALVGRVQGRSLAIATATASLEACAGLTGRAFMAAEVSGPPMLTEALTPARLELIGRSIIRRGELVLMIDTTTGMLRLTPCETWDVSGDPSPDQ